MADALRASGVTSCHGKYGKRLRSASFEHLLGCLVLSAATATANEGVWNADARLTSLTHYQFLSACRSLIGLLLYNVQHMAARLMRIAQTAPVYLHYDVNWHARGVTGGPSPHISSDMFYASNIHSYLSIVYQEPDTASPRWVLPTYCSF